MKIEVTQEDIDKGVYKQCRLCPVALAVSRAFSALDVSISQMLILVYFQEPRPRLRFDTPLGASEFITKFDNNEPVKPFTFELNHP